MLPNYVMIDTKSRWHVGGLLSTAYETMTLPSRLRLGNGSRASLDELVNVLNVNGNQNIAKVRMSIDQKDAPNGHHGSARLKIRAQSRIRECLPRRGGVPLPAADLPAADRRRRDSDGRGARV